MLGKVVFLSGFLAFGSAFATELNMLTYFNFTGTVTAVQPGVTGIVVGQQVPIVVGVNYADNIFTVNSLHTVGTHSGGVGQSRYNLIQYQNFNNVPNTNAHFIQSVTVQKNDNGVYGYHMTAYDQEIGTAFQIDLTTSVSGVVRNLFIPQTITPSQFQSSTFTIYQTPFRAYSGTLN